MIAKVAADRRIVFCCVGETPSIFSRLQDDVINDYRRTPGIEHGDRHLRNFRVSGGAK